MLACHTFKDIEVRTVEKGGLVWFVASDIAKALNYRNADDMTRVLDDDEADTHIVRIPSKNQYGAIGDIEKEVIIINESGMYHALLKSRKPEAKPFRKWVTSEVLPSIRKTGSYTAPQPASHTINPAQQNALQQLVAQKSGESGGIRAYIWSRFNNHFQLGSYKQLPAERFAESVGYLANMEVKETLPLLPKRYDYPRKLLEQPYFKTDKTPASLSIMMLSDTTQFVSPLFSLLNELRSEGHDMGAPWDEAVAMREAIQRAEKTLDGITNSALRGRASVSSMAGN